MSAAIARGLREAAIIPAFPVVMKAATAARERRIPPRDPPENPGSISEGGGAVRQCLAVHDSYSDTDGKEVEEGYNAVGREHSPGNVFTRIVDFLGDGSHLGEPSEGNKNYSGGGKYFHAAMGIEGKISVYLQLTNSPQDIVPQKTK